MEHDKYTEVVEQQLITMDASQISVNSTSNNYDKSFNPF